MTGFEAWTYGAGGNCPDHCFTTTAAPVTLMFSPRPY